MEKLGICVAVCRIGAYTLYRRLCCKKRPVPRPEYSPVCIGVGPCGKSSLLCALSGESLEEVQPTSGFSIKAVQFKDCILNIKEIGGSDKVRPFWYHYFRDAQAIIFVVDSSGSQTDMEQVHEELEKALNDKALRGLPLLVIASCQDKPDARSLQERPLTVLLYIPNNRKMPAIGAVQRDSETVYKVQMTLDLETLCRGREWFIHGGSLSDLDGIRAGFTKLNAVLTRPTSDDEEVREQIEIGSLDNDNRL